MKASHILQIIVLSQLPVIAPLFAESSGVGPGRHIHPTAMQLREFWQIIDRREPTPSEVQRAENFFQTNQLPPREDVQGRQQAIGRFFQEVLDRPARPRDVIRTMGYLEMEEALKDAKREIRNEIAQAVKNIQGLGFKEGRDGKGGNFGPGGKGGFGFRGKRGRNGGPGGNGAPGEDGEGEPSVRRSGHGGDGGGEESPDGETGPAFAEGVREALGQQVRNGQLLPSEADALLRQLAPALAAGNTNSLSPEQLADAAAREIFSGPPASDSPFGKPSNAERVADGAGDAPRESLLRGLDEIAPKMPKASASSGASLPILEPPRYGAPPAPVPAAPAAAPSSFTYSPYFGFSGASAPTAALKAAAGAEKTSPPRALSSGIGMGGSWPLSPAKSGEGIPVGSLTGKRAGASAPTTVAGKVVKRAGEFLKKVIAAFVAIKDKALGSAGRRTASEGDGNVTLLTATNAPRAPTPVPFSAIAAAEARALPAMDLALPEDMRWDLIDWGFASALLLTTARLAFLLRRRLRPRKAPGAHF